MIRLIIIAIGLFLIWVLFVANLSRQRKIAIAAIAVALSVAAIWLESSLGTPRENLLATSDIEDCGTSATHSYRSDFDISLCLQNNSKIARVTRLGFEVLALQCNAAQECQEVQRVAREVPVDLAANSRSTLKQSLSFDQVSTQAKDIQWRVEVTTVHAVKSMSK